jgi:glutamyl-tRNA synthetase
VLARTCEAGQTGVPTYNFCVVIDDTGMEVTHVIRGDDHVANTPKQIALYHALGFEVPVFAHVPMILGMDGAKLSKRHGATSITDYQSLGLLPSAVRLALAKLSWTPKIDGKAAESAQEEILSDAQMIELFDLDDIQKSPARFDMDKLYWINQKLIQRSGWRELETRLRPFLPDAWDTKPETWKQRAITITQKSKSLVEMANTLAFCWSAPTEFEGVEKYITPATKPALRDIVTLSDYEHDPLQVAFNEILERYGMKTKDLAPALRVALCGRPVSPGILDTLYLLGVEEVRHRLEKWL